MQKHQPMSSLFITPLLYLIIFFTGASGLIYEVTWQKYLSRLLGSDSIATAIILAVFLGGLSLGYFLCGKISVYIRNHLKAYAVMEGIIGAWCLFFPTIFGWVEALTESWSFAPPVLVIVQGVICSSLLMAIPTICMGSTIPFLTRGISKNIVEATHVHARVYAINTAGAFIGTLLAGFILIPIFGLPLTMMAAASLNLSAFVIIYILQQWMRIDPAGETAVNADIETVQSSYESPRTRPPWHLYTIAFLSGFYVMTLENALIRISNISLGSSSYSFTLVIAVFILCIAVGSFIVGRYRHISKKMLYTNQLLISLSLFVVFITMDTWPYWAHLIRVSVQSNSIGFWLYYIVVFQVLLIVLGAPVALMGATVPIAFHELKRDIKNVGRHSGYLFSLNTIGSLSGSLIGGIVLYHFLNSGRIFMVAATLAGISTLIAGIDLGRTRIKISAAVTAVLALFTILGSGYTETHFANGVFRNRHLLENSLAGPTKFFDSIYNLEEIKYYNDGPTATVAAIEYDRGPNTKSMSIMVNGKSDSDTVGDAYTLKLSAHLPALLAEKRNDAMVIGLGTGVTAGELSLYNDVERIDVAEISPSVIEALPLFSKYTHAVHKSPKLNIIAADAFRVLGRSDKLYDVIISEPSNPWVTGVDMLFTQEFYLKVRQHMKPKGLFMQWTQMYSANETMVGMVISTVKSIFRYCNVFVSYPGDLLILASNYDITEADVVRAREVLSQNPKVADSLRVIEFDNLDTILMRQIWSDSYTELYLDNYVYQTMDNPRLHYLAGHCFFEGINTPAKFYFNSKTAHYSSDYLLAKGVADWNQRQISADWEASVVRSMSAQHGYRKFPAAKYVKFRYAYQQWKQSGRVESNHMQRDLRLLSLIENRSPEYSSWKNVGLQNTSYRRKAEVLLDHVDRLRSWITPYPIDGLKSLLQDGSIHGKDDFEKNWCILQLALIAATDDIDMEKVRHYYSRLIKDPSGRIIIEDELKATVIELVDQVKRAG